MPLTYYAVKRGHTVGLFTDSYEFTESISNFHRPVYRYFKNKRQATNYLGPVKLRDLKVAYGCTLQIYICGIRKPSTGEIGYGLVMVHNKKVVYRSYGGYEQNGTTNKATYNALLEALSWNKGFSGVEHNVEIIINNRFVYTEFQKYSSTIQNRSINHIRRNEDAELLRACLKTLGDYQVTLTFDRYPDGKLGYEHSFRLACLAIDEKVDDTKLIDDDNGFF